MCEFWKWLMIGTIIPLLLIRVSISLFVSKEVRERAGAWLYPFRWWVVFGQVVFFFAFVVYVSHCAT